VNPHSDLVFNIKHILQDGRVMPEPDPETVQKVFPTDTDQRLQQFKASLRNTYPCGTRIVIEVYQDGRIRSFLDPKHKYIR
jgi:hypothetical protein